jgi:chromosome segregation ATPase
MFGQTPTSSQASGQKLPPSELNSMTLGELQERGLSTLASLRTHLTQAKTELTASKASLQNVLDALDKSQERITALEAYNDQIGARMQERDTDLSAAYIELDRVKSGAWKKNVTIIIEGAFILILVYLQIRKPIKALIPWLP